jgi:glucose-6-phosphate isomerase
MFTKNIFFKNFNVKKKNFRVRNILSNLVNEQNHILFSLSKNYKNSFDIKKIAKYKKFSQFRVIGMGGSTLGTQCIYDFLKHKIKKKFVFVDNLQVNQKKKI